MGFFFKKNKDTETPQLSSEIRNNLKIIQDGRHGSLFGVSNGFSNGEYMFYFEKKTGKIAWFGTSSIEVSQNQFSKGTVVLEGGLIRSFQTESKEVNAESIIQQTIEAFNQFRKTGKKAT